jgi:hypothetical protein
LLRYYILFFNTVYCVYLCYVFFSLFFYSAIFPLAGYFFLIKISDWSKDYKPESKIVLDIPTALNFFSKSPDFTKKMVGDKVRTLIKKWNDKFAGNKEVYTQDFIK